MSNESTTSKSDAITLIDRNEIRSRLPDIIEETEEIDEEKTIIVEIKKENDDEKKTDHENNDEKKTDHENND